MTLIRLPDGDLWIHSPTSLTDVLAGQVLQAGPVQFLIALNTLHSWWIPDWKKRFPDALVYAAPGLDRSTKRPLPVDQVLGNAPLSAWAGSLTKPCCGVTCSLGSPSSTTRHAPYDLIENFELGPTGDPIGFCCASPAPPTKGSDRDAINVPTSSQGGTSGSRAYGILRHIAISSRLPPARRRAR
jgi:hypothetical protein